MMSMSSTDPGDRSAAEIEREVDRERERVSDTIEALQSKVSMQNVVDQVASAVSEHGGEVSRNIGRALRDNPLPAILTGVGLAWLMASSGSRPSRQHEDWEDRYPTTPPRDYGSAGSARDEEPTYPGYGSSELGGTVASEREGLSLRERANEWGEGVSEAASGVYEAAKGALGETGNALSGARHSAYRAGGRAQRWSGRQADDVQDRLQTGLEQHPLALGGIAFAIGAALGAVLPRTRAEDELVGPHADRLKASATEIASSEANKAMAVASAVVEEGKQIAEEVAGQLPDGETAIERTREAAVGVAERLRSAAQSEADRQKLGDPSP